MNTSNCDFKVNSLVHAIKGNNEEARRIQEEFGKTSLNLLESFPVVGHAMSAGYAIAGDAEKAAQVALSATKSTVVVAAGIGCGPAAPACAAAAGNL